MKWRSMCLDACMYCTLSTDARKMSLVGGFDRDHGPAFFWFIEDIGGADAAPARAPHASPRMSDAC